jgi:hypothetical protein
MSVVFVHAFAQAQAVSRSAPKAFYIYKDGSSPDNHYFPSGWMGDYGDISFDHQAMGYPHSGSTCIEIIYTAKKSQGKGWAGIYWQDPANNWGTKKGGFDLTGMTKLTFWARGAKGGEILHKFLVGGIKGGYPDSATAEIGPVKLTYTWKQYTINLAGKDLSSVSGGFCWVTNTDLNPAGATFYLDDMKFEADPAMKPEIRRPEAMPFYVYSDSKSLQNHFIPSGWMGDYGDITFESNCVFDPVIGDTCIKITYSAKVSQGMRWAGIYWQNPADNWGTVDSGFDLSRATKITFWAKGAKGKERIEEFKVGGILGKYPDSDAVSIGPIALERQWKKYTIDLRGKDMSNIIGGFCWATNIDVNPEGAVFYLDEIKFE